MGWVLLQGVGGEGPMSSHCGGDGVQRRAVKRHSKSHSGKGTKLFQSLFDI